MQRLLIGISIVIFNASVLAQSGGAAPYTPDAGPVAGNWEATLTGSGLSDDSFDNSNFGLSGSLGYFLTKNLLFSVKQGLTTTDSNDNTLLGGRTIFQAAYQFDRGKWQPYVGFNIGGIYGAAFEDDALFGPEVGIKYYVNESTFLYGNVSYEVPIDGCCKDGVVPYAVGVGFNF